MNNDEIRNNDLDKVIELSKQTAFNVQDMNKQMGIIAAEIRDVKTAYRQVVTDVKNVNDDLQQYKTYAEESKYIPPSKQEEMEQAVKGRVAELLNALNLSESDFKKYFGKFTSRCWCDTKKTRLIFGRKGVYTPQRNFDAAIKYINAWEPVKHGTVGYIDYLDRIGGE